MAPIQEQKQEQKTADKKPSSHRLTPAVAIFGVTAIYFLSQIIGTGLIYLFGELRGMNEAQTYDWLRSSVSAQFMLYLAVAGLGLFGVKVLLRWARVSWQAIGLKKPRPKDALYAVVGYGYYIPLYIVLSILVGLFFPALDFQQEQQIGFDTGISGLQLGMAFVSLVILPPLIEEILMRGVLFTGLRRRFNLWIAGFITSVLFALAHLQWGSEAPLLWAAAVDTFVLSAVLVVLREKTGSLWPAIGLHAIKNLVAFSLLFIFKIS